MAINKTFVPHTELKAADLNELVDQANGYVGQVDRAKPNTVDIAQYNSEGAELPLASYYVYYGNPTHALAGRYADTDIYFIAVCISHWELSHAIVLYVKNEQNKYIYSESFRSDQASSDLEKYIAGLFAGAPVTYDHDGLMKSEDKRMFDDMVLEVFPLTVVVASSNAGTYEVGDAQHSVTPQIVLSITRKGADVSASAQTTSSQGEVQSDNKTIIGSALTNGTTAFQISVTQGGQTVDAPDQKFEFMNYRYRGAVSANNIPSDATAKTNYVKTLCQNNTISKELSSSTQLTGKNALAAGNCYVFVIPTQSPNLIVKDANSGGVVDNAGTGTFTLRRVNDTGDVNCKYVIVPASPNAWNFEITN